GIYWNNHHHLFQLVDVVDGHMLWANLHLLFWLSLIPFTTAWMGESGWAAFPTALYGGVLLMAAIAWLVLEATILARQGSDSALRRAVGRDFKSKASAAAYAVAIPVAFVNAWIALAVYVGVAIVWFVPDRRIESRVTS